MKKTFPRPEDAGPEGILQVSDDISVERLLEAYSSGIFPWPTVGYPILWFSPAERGILTFDRFHQPRSLVKWRKQPEIRFSWNTQFATVIENCRRQPRPGQAGTWITPKLKRAYLDFHEAGHAHSVECWHEEKLIGGLYGVYVGGVFCGESMYFIESNASKACLAFTVEFLQSKGLHWMDVQMITPTVEQMGGTLISRNEFLTRLEKAKDAPIPIRFESDHL